jgi:tRNA pseudouridine38-40 synthase
MTTTPTRFRIDVAYDGAKFSGWAAQTGLRTVQGDLEAWIARVLRLETRPILICAGRTDSGVHARGQVAHFDLVTEDPAGVVDTLTLRLGRALHDDLVMRAVSIAPPGFNARYSAIWRRYAYRLTDGVLDPLDRFTTARVRSPLDLPAMNSAGEVLLGLHNFAAFCRARKGATTIRELQHVWAERLPDGRVEIGVRADAFCHSMVRSLVGALVEVGTGGQDATWLAELVNARTRCGEVLVMPAKGLVLEEVGYPADSQLAARAIEARARRELDES